MLHRLEIANFHSIRDAQVIDLRARRSRATATANVLAPVWPGADEFAPKVVALFGANASGKSNVLKALGFISWFLTHSFRTEPDAKLPYEPFADEAGYAADTRLLIWFPGPADTSHPATGASCRYAYEVVLREAPRPPQRVIRETLRYWPEPGGVSIQLLERDADAKLSAAPTFGLDDYRQAVSTVLRGSASVIDTLAQLRHPLAEWMRHWAEAIIPNIIYHRNEWRRGDLAIPYVTHPHLLTQFNRDVERLSLGIRRMELMGNDERRMLLFHHQGPHAAFFPEMESHGTLQFVHIYPMIQLALDRGGLAVIDELDSALHPTLLAEVLRWFRDPVRNPRNAQLWTSCQNTALLDELAREEILFCEKDSVGRSTVYGLRDVRKVRAGDNFARNYLGGTYGALPHVG